jgi:hypothetical protein
VKTMTSNGSVKVSAIHRCSRNNKALLMRDL